MTYYCIIEARQPFDVTFLNGSGGIQRYMEAFPGYDSLFRGSLFVFDERISVPSTAGTPSSFALCKTLLFGASLPEN